SEPVFGLEFEGARLDIGNQLEFIKSNLLMGLEDPRMKESLWDFIQSLKQP
ncbi:MAG TPA: UTP--glucose-1-phosphate uridylyltransferase, partial [Verrucomicrobiales bacterium]|nr:UTP--glucose-1-phosphate uridylyltransferase [Verrucomicrobiales bacterium]